MAQKLTKRYRTFIDCHGNPTDITRDYGKSTTYHHADDGSEYDTIDQVVSDVVDNAKCNIPPLPGPGEQVEVDQLYIHNGQIYKVRQSHRVTIYDPSIIPALFTVFRKEGDTPNIWIPGEKVDVGTVRIIKDVTYEAIQAHVTQSDWTPDKTPTLWKVWEEPTNEIPEWKQPTGAHDAYNIGDQVIFNGNTYESVINANVWSPAIYAAGWKKI